MTPKLEQRLVIKQDAIISHFCWAYTNALLQKLILMDNEDKIFSSGGNNALHMEADEHRPSNLTEMALSIITSIGDQIGISYVNYFQATPSVVARVISTCQEYLDIFVDKSTSAEQDQDDDSSPDYDDLRNETIDLIASNLDDGEAADDILKMLREKYKFIPR